ncbi:30S ribosomal protein S17, partial [Dysosmobacter welbionis]
SGQGHSAQPPKRKPPFYRRKWFIILMVLFVIGIIGNLVERPQEQVASDQANETAQDEKESLDTPKTPAEIDAELCDAVISADVQMDALS